MTEQNRTPDSELTGAVTIVPRLLFFSGLLGYIAMTSFGLLQSIPHSETVIFMAFATGSIASVVIRNRWYNKLLVNDTLLTRFAKVAALFMGVLAVFVDAGTFSFTLAMAVFALIYVTGRLVARWGNVKDVVLPDLNQRNHYR